MKNNKDLYYNIVNAFTSHFVSIEETLPDIYSFNKLVLTHNKNKGINISVDLDDYTNISFYVEEKYVRLFILFIANYGYSARLEINIEEFKDFFTIETLFQYEHRVDNNPVFKEHLKNADFVLMQIGNYDFFDIKLFEYTNQSKVSFVITCYIHFVREPVFKTSVRTCKYYLQRSMGENYNKLIKIIKD